jgi:ParB family chromosome partitioning protein
MRHDSHYVDQLHRPVGDPVGRMISVDEIEPNPHQPRQALGDLSELAASVREKGVLEPVLVRRHDGRYQIIAGERRYRAACEAGLDEIPCIVREADDAEVMELALIENIQRKDLTAFEEADSLKALADNHAYTHEALAERLGKGCSSSTSSNRSTTISHEMFSRRCWSACRRT